MNKREITKLIKDNLRWCKELEDMMGQGGGSIVDAIGTFDGDAHQLLIRSARTLRDLLKEREVNK